MIECALQWTEATDEYIQSYVNGIPTGNGGTHENGLKSALGKAVRGTGRIRNIAIVDSANRPALASGTMYWHMPPGGTGFTRVSLGMQSAAPHVLRVLERTAFDQAAFAKEKDALITQMRDERRARAFQSYMQAARRRYPVERRGDVYRRVVS